MNDEYFEKVRSLFENDNKEFLLVFCGEYFKQINSMDAKKLSWPKLSSWDVLISRRLFQEIKRESPLSPSNMWHMMKNEMFSYFVQWYTNVYLETRWVCFLKYYFKRRKIIKTWHVPKIREISQKHWES
jgi:hypothetical protein